MAEREAVVFPAVPRGESLELVLRFMARIAQVREMRRSGQCGAGCVETVRAIEAVPKRKSPEMKALLFSLGLLPDLPESSCVSLMKRLFDVGELAGHFLGVPLHAFTFQQQQPSPQAHQQRRAKQHRSNLSKVPQYGRRPSAESTSSASSGTSASSRSTTGEYRDDDVDVEQDAQWGDVPLSHQRAIQWLPSSVREATYQGDDSNRIPSPGLERVRDDAHRDSPLSLDNRLDSPLTLLDGQDVSIDNLSIGASAVSSSDDVRHPVPARFRMLHVSDSGLSVDSVDSTIDAPVPIPLSLDSDTSSSETPSPLLGSRVRLTTTAQRGSSRRHVAVRASPDSFEHSVASPDEHDDDDEEEEEDDGDEDEANSAAQQQQEHGDGATLTTLSFGTLGTESSNLLCQCNEPVLDFAMDSVYHNMLRSYFQQLERRRADGRRRKRSIDRLGRRRSGSRSGSGSRQATTARKNSGDSSDSDADVDEESDNDRSIDSGTPVLEKDMSWVSFFEVWTTADFLMLDAMCYFICRHIAAECIVAGPDYFSVVTDPMLHTLHSSIVDRVDRIGVDWYEVPDKFLWQLSFVMVFSSETCIARIWSVRIALIDLWKKQSGVQKRLYALQTKQVQDQVTAPLPSPHPTLGGHVTPQQTPLARRTTRHDAVMSAVTESPYPLSARTFRRRLAERDEEQHPVSSWSTHSFLSSSSTATSSSALHQPDQPDASRNDELGLQVPLGADAFLHMLFFTPTWRRIKKELLTDYSFDPFLRHLFLRCTRMVTEADDGIFWDSRGSGISGGRVLPQSLTDVLLECRTQAENEGFGRKKNLLKVTLTEAFQQLVPNLYLLVDLVQTCERFDRAVSLGSRSKSKVERLRSRQQQLSKILFKVPFALVRLFGGSQVLESILLQIRKAPAFGDLRQLDLHACADLSPKTIIACLRRTPELRWLDLSGVRRVDASVCAAIIKHCPMLEYLDLSNCPRVNDAAILSMADEMRRRQLAKIKHDTMLRSASDTHSRLMALSMDSEAHASQKRETFGTFAGEAEALPAADSSSADTSPAARTTSLQKRAVTTPQLHRLADRMARAELGMRSESENSVNDSPSPSVTSSDGGGDQRSLSDFVQSPDTATLVRVHRDKGGIKHGGSAHVLTSIDEQDNNNKGGSGSNSSSSSAARSLKMSGAALSKLRMLNVSNCERVSDASLLAFKESFALEDLCVAGCFRVTDKGLLHLASQHSSKLRYICVSGAYKVSQHALRFLFSKNPNLVEYSDSAEFGRLYLPSNAKRPYT